MKANETVTVSIDHAFEASVHLEAGNFALKAPQGTMIGELEGPALRVGAEIGADKVLITGVRPGPEQNELFVSLLDIREGTVVASTAASVKPGVVSYGRAAEVIDGLGIRTSQPAESAGGGGFQILEDGHLRGSE